MIEQILTNRGPLELRELSDLTGIRVMSLAQRVSAMEAAGRLRIDRAHPRSKVRRWMVSSVSELTGEALPMCVVHGDMQVSIICDSRLETPDECSECRR